MKKKYLISLVLIIIIFFILYLDNNKNLRVAHAGGQFEGKTYPNSIQSISFNTQYTKYFELDFQLTKDRRLVCLHHPNVSNNYFHEIKDEIFKNNYCYDKILKDFLKKNKEVIIITDFKSDNIEGVSFIKDYFNQESSRFIPQIYYENEYQKAKDLGFDKIIFTFYRMSNHSNEQISKIIKQMDLFAITMDPARLRSGIIKKIDKNSFFVYVYTVNSFLRFLQYKIFFGADEIYTDTLF